MAIKEVHNQMECPNCKQLMAINFLDLNSFSKLPCFYCKEGFRPNSLSGLLYVGCWFFSLTFIFLILVKICGVGFPTARDNPILLNPNDYLPRNMNNILILIGAVLSGLLHFCLFYLIFPRLGKLVNSSFDFTFNKKFIRFFVLLYLGIGYIGLTIEFAYLVLDRVLRILN